MIRKVFLLMSFAFGLVFNVQAQSENKSVSLEKTEAVSVTKNKKQQAGEVLSESTIKLFDEKDTPSEVTKETIDELLIKAKQGDVVSQLDLGYMYLYGINGAEINYPEALRWYEAAAAQNSAVALNNLGSFYFNGIGTHIDYPKAISFFEKAANLGSDDAAVNLAIIYLGSENKHKNDEDLKKAIELLEKAQDHNTIAKYLLGYAYFTGFQVTKDINKAFKLIKTAADEGYDEAQLIISDFYIQGHGTPKNYNRAIQYLKMATEQGNPDALMKLGDILVDGKIYTKNIIEAHVYYNVASVMGVKNAASKRDTLENSIPLETLLSIQTQAENYTSKPSKQTLFIRQTYGNSLKIYIDLNLKKTK